MADFDLVNYARGMNPVEQQLLMANVLKKKERGDQGEALAAANREAHRFDQLQAISQMINNPGAANAAKIAAANAVAANKPAQMGTQGFMLPGSGQFVESPMFADEKAAGREAALEGRRMQVEAANERARDTNFLVQTLREAEERGRNERARLDRISRETLAEERRKADKEKAGKGKELGYNDIAKFTAKEAAAGTMGDIASSFQDSFSKPIGRGIPLSTTKLENALGNAGVEKYAGQANWWKNYNEQKNKIRNELFGSALTATEKAAFDAANIEEGMDPEVIRTRLRQQHSAAVKAYNKLKKNLGASFDMSKFSDMMDPGDVMPGTGGTKEKPAESADDDALINKYLNPPGKK